MKIRMAPLSIFVAVMLSFLVCTPLSAQTQNIRFEQIPLEGALSQNAVLSILQDSRGFMWFGTFDGLNKYDGYQFIVYGHDPDNSNSLSNNEVRSIFESRLGELWIGTENGLNRYDRRTDQFIRFKHEPNDPNSLSHNAVNTIFESSSGELWIGTENGLNRYDRRSDQFIRFKHDPNDPNSLSHNVVTAILENKSGDLWIGTDGGGLNRFDGQSAQFRHFNHDANDPNSLGSDIIRSLYADNSGIIWIGTEDAGLVKYDEEKQQFTRYKHQAGESKSLSSNNVISLFEDQSGTLWIGTYGGGVNIFDRDREQFSHYKHDSNNPKSLSNDVVLSIYEDQSGILWIGTFGGGLNRYDRQKEQFRHYKHQAGNLNSLSNNNVYWLYEDKSGILWIGTFGGGVNRYDREAEQFRHYRHDADNSNSISSDIAYSIYEDKLGILWIGTDGGGLNRFDQETEQFSHYRHDANNPNSLSDEKVYAILEDRSGALWVGTSNGLNRFDREEENFEQFKNDADDSNSLSGNIIYVIYEDRAGTLWIGTSNGLNKLNRQTETFTHYKYDVSEPHSISNSVIHSIYEDRSGILWVGTAGGGLNKFDRTTERFKRYSVSDGLPNNVIYGIIEDDNDNLWLSTNKGLSRFNPQTEIFRNYDVNDGLQSNEFNSNAAFKTWDGRLFFGGINGFNVFHPDSIRDNPTIPSVVITDFKIFNRSVSINVDDEMDGSYSLDSHIAEATELTLSYKEVVFSFDFAALHYAASEKNQYAYMMEGFDEDWIYTDASRRIATYTNLDAGHYTFRVKGSNKDGIWNDIGASLKVIITPPWWETWWFRGIVILFILGIGQILYFWRTSALRRKSAFERLVRVVAMSSNEATNVETALKSLLKEVCAYADWPIGHVYLPANDSSGQLRPTTIWQLQHPERFETFKRITEKTSFDPGVGLPGRVFSTGKPAWITDVTKDTNFPRAKLATDIGVKAGFGFPVLVGTEVVAVLEFFSSEAVEPDDALLEIMANVGTQLGRVFERKQAEEALRRKNESQRLLLTVAVAAAQAIDFETAFRSILKLVCDYTKWPIGHVYLPAEDSSGQLEPTTIWQLQKPKRFETFKRVTERTRIDPGVGLPGRVYSTGKPAWITDVSKDTNFPRAKLAKDIGVKAGFGFPVLVGTEVVAVLEFFSSEVVEPDEALLEILANVSTQLGWIFERKQAEKALLESEGKFRDLVEKSLVGVYLIQDDRFKYVNPRLAEIVGYSIEEIIDKMGPKDFVHPDDWPVVEENMRRRMEADIDTIQYETRAQNKNKEIVHIEVFGSKTIYRGQPAIIGTFVDISERKTIEVQLRQSQKMEVVGQMAGGVAHDFNNLLTVILFYAEELHETLVGEHVLVDLEQILYAGNRAADLTRQLLAFSRKEMIKPVTLQLNDVISDMTKMLRRLIPEDIGFEVHLSDDVLTIEADPGQVEQVLVNCVVNAKDAIGELADRDAEKRITISTEARFLDEEYVRSNPGATEGDYCSIIITDTGVGMGDEVRDKVFEPFFTTKEVGMGTGLGMSTIYGIVKQNEGYIEIESARGQGTTFHIHWPVQKVARVESDETTETKEFQAKAMVLFAEDELIVREVGTSILKSLGLEFIEAENGRDALAKVSKLSHPIDLLIADVVMPEMNGLALAEELQKRFPKLKVILTSGYTSNPVLRQNLIERGFAFISKPYSKKSLGDKIQEILSVT